MCEPKLLSRGGGPKTPSGKKRSSRNSFRHGLFSSEFSFSAADEAKFSKLCAGLREVLKPKNALRELIFNDVVACAWRMRVALRFEQRELLRHLSAESKVNSEEKTDPSYLSGLKLRQREHLSKLLDSIECSIKRDGVLPTEVDGEVTKNFGPNFLKRLREWTPLDTKSVMMLRLAEVASARDALYNVQSRMADLPPSQKRESLEEHAQLKQEMITKTIDIYRDMINELSNSADGVGGALLEERVGRLDLSIRYLTTARRDFYRVLCKYQEVSNTYL
jgi:hypothetical protein